MVLIPLQMKFDAEGSKHTHLATCAAYFLRSFRIGLGADFWRSSTAISSVNHKQTNKYINLVDPE